MRACPHSSTLGGETCKSTQQNTWIQAIASGRVLLHDSNIFITWTCSTCWRNKHVLAPVHSLHQYTTEGTCARQGHAELGTYRANGSAAHRSRRPQCDASAGKIPATHARCTCGGHGMHTAAVLHPSPMMLRSNTLEPFGFPYPQG